MGVILLFDILINVYCSFKHTLAVGGDFMFSGRGKARASSVACTPDLYCKEQTWQWVWASVHGMGTWLASSSCSFTTSHSCFTWSWCISVMPWALSCLFITLLVLDSCNNDNKHSILYMYQQCMQLISLNPSLVNPLAKFHKVVTTMWQYWQP